MGCAWSPENLRPALLPHGAVPLLDALDHLATRLGHGRHRKTVALDLEAQLPSELMGPDFADGAEGVVGLRLRHGEAIGEALGITVPKSTLAV